MQSEAYHRDLPPICFKPLPMIMTDREVAVLLRTELATLKAWHSKWTRSNGFPRPLPGMSPNRWSGPQLEAWLAPERATVIPDDAPRALDKLLDRYVGASL